MSEQDTPPPPSALAVLLAPPGGVVFIGPEEGVPPKARETRVRLYSSVPPGSYRAVSILDGEIVAALQWMAKEGSRGWGTIANMYTRKDHRRQGHASKLQQFARITMAGRLRHAANLSADALAFAQAHDSGPGRLVAPYLDSHLAKTSELRTFGPELGTPLTAIDRAVDAVRRGEVLDRQAIRVWDHDEGRYVRASVAVHGSGLDTVVTLTEDMVD